MRKIHVAAATSAALLVASVSGTAWTSATAAPQGEHTGGQQSYVVLAEHGQSATAIAKRLRSEGATVTSVNTGIGMVTATSTEAGFRAEAGQLQGVEGVAADRRLGTTPKRDVVERENLGAQGSQSTKGDRTNNRPVKSDPFDGDLWGMKMIEADQAHRITMGSHKVKVGIMDTGVQADHPDLHGNFDYDLSRNFTTDMTDVDGPCEHESCVDPVGEDDNGHGTHVAGTIAAAMNGFGVSGVAPRSSIVEVRAGQDSGYFFVGPTVNALTYSGDAGLDVVNMSFYVDPWAYNCLGGAPEDTPEQAADQAVIIEAVNRALDYAHDKNVTLVAAAGNNHEDLANPRTDFSSPDYGEDPHPRTITNSNCFDLPVEGPNVLGTVALGPSAKKSDFSNYTTDLASGEVEFSAPGGWYRDGFGTSTHRTNENMILSSVPLVALQDSGEVDADGNITELGEATGAKKACQADPEPGTTECGYYAFFQGTSMAAPHAAGVAALAVAAHGTKVKGGGLTMAPDAVRDLLTSTATDHACPEGGVQSYLDEGRSAEFTATCVGTPQHNGFYGAGIVNALGVVR